MAIEILNLSDPFFKTMFVTDKQAYAVTEPTIFVNVDEAPVEIESQKMAQFESMILRDVTVKNVNKAILITGFDNYEDEDAFLAKVRETWPVAYSIRPEERLKGKEHYLSPKANMGNIFVSMYHAGSVPLNVGLHKDHVHHGDAVVKEVHTQIVGYGKMQQCREKDLSTMYCEELMAPGATHRPMFDEAGDYPWHQYETITPGIFMAIEVVSPR